MIKLREVLFGFGQLKKNLTPLCVSFQCSRHFGGKAFKADECVCCKDVKLMHLDKCFGVAKYKLEKLFKFDMRRLFGSSHVLSFHCGWLDTKT